MIRSPEERDYHHRRHHHHHHDYNDDESRLSCPLLTTAIDRTQKRVQFLVGRDMTESIAGQCETSAAGLPTSHLCTHSSSSLLIVPSRCTFHPHLLIQMFSFTFIFLFAVLCRVTECSSVVPVAPLIGTSNQSSSDLLSGARTTALPLTHHHHHSHFHLSKLLFPLASSSFTTKSFKPTTKPKGSLSSPNETSHPGSVMAKRDLSFYGRKRKRELFALTIAEDAPLKTLRPDNFWSNSGPVVRRRRVSGHNGGGSGSQSSLYNKQKSFALGMSSLSGLSSSSGMTSSMNVANAAAGSMRMKIIPPGFGAGLLPDQKCNFEIYPSGCFDENGSICDSSGSGLCICRPGYTISSGKIYCLRPAAIGEACYTTEQCVRKVANSGCFNYREEYREENPSAFFGPSQSSWPMGECRCRVGHRYDEQQKACVKSLIGSWCSNVWDCDWDEKVAEGESGHKSHANHSRYGGLPISMTSWHGSGHGGGGAHGGRAKMANFVCEHNSCNCSQFFHYNASAEECQYVETFGQLCQPDLNSMDSAMHSKRNTRSRASPPQMPPSYSVSRHRQSSYHSRQLQSLPEDISEVTCNLPSICSTNGTCVCAEGFEHQAAATPQCQPLNKVIGSHFTHYFHSGSSGRSGVKGDGHGVTMFDRGSEGQSSIGNFVEYVMYVLVPALVVIFLFKPCFRRIGEWRNHIHQYSSDSDFYLSANGLPPVIGEVNVIAPAAAVVDKTTTGQFTSFIPHMACHNAYLFESPDGCYAYGSGCISPTAIAAAADPSMALVREKLQTIEETQSEDAANQHDQPCATTNFVITAGERPPCCVVSVTGEQRLSPDHTQQTRTENEEDKKEDNKTENGSENIEMVQLQNNKVTDSLIDPNSPNGSVPV